MKTCLMCSQTARRLTVEGARSYPIFCSMHCAATYGLKSALRFNHYCADLRRWVQTPQVLCTCRSSTAGSRFDVDS